MHARPPGFVLDLPPEFGHAHAGDVPGQPAVACHAGHVQVFHHDRTEPPDQAGRQLVQPIAAGVGDRSVQPRDPGLGRAPASRRCGRGAPVRSLPAGSLALQPPQLAQGEVKVAGVGDDLAGRQHRQRRDAEVHTDSGVRPGRCGIGAGDLHRQRHEPAATPMRHCRRPDPGAAPFDMPRELAGRLVRADGPDPREFHVPAVAVDQAERAGGEPARQPGPLAFEPRKPDRRPTPPAGAGRGPVAQRGRQVGQTRRVCLFGVLRPPRGDLVLDLVPDRAQPVGRPRQRRGELTGGDAVGLLRLPLAKVGLDPRQSPVVGVTLRTTMRPQHRILPRSRVQRELIRLKNCHHSAAITRRPRRSRRKRSR